MEKYPYEHGTVVLQKIKRRQNEEEVTLLVQFILPLQTAW
jgi:hypothetical protein